MRNSTAIIISLAMMGHGVVHAETGVRQKAVKPGTGQAAAVRAASPKPAAAPARTAAASRSVVESPMGQEELQIAQRVHQGHMPCELGAAVRVESDQVQPGYFNVHGKGFRYRMHPVVTSTGAIRLEDKQAGAVWLQLANKSMLMDQRKGQRVADECAHPEQMAFAADMKNNPPPKLFDTTGMGRND